jgi:hypothetical protein
VSPRSLVKKKSSRMSLCLPALRRENLSEAAVLVANIIEAYWMLCILPIRTRR